MSSQPDQAAATPQQMRADLTIPSTQQPLTTATELDTTPQGSKGKLSESFLHLFGIEEANGQYYTAIKNDLNAIPDRVRKAVEKVARLDNRLQVIVEDIRVHRGYVTALGRQVQNLRSQVTIVSGSFVRPAAPEGYDPTWIEAYETQGGMGVILPGRGPMVEGEAGAWMVAHLEFYILHQATRQLGKMVWARKRLGERIRRLESRIEEMRTRLDGGPAFLRGIQADARIIRQEIYRCVRLEDEGGAWVAESMDPATQTAIGRIMGRTWASNEARAGPNNGSQESEEEAEGET
ncbi:hypothetical protein MMC12_007104 [Toensbergia leucococca]|nr:hypothetical protein [Toensbergia leucococca]